MKERGLAPILIVLLVVGLIGAGIGAYIISQSGQQSEQQPENQQSEQQSEEGTQSQIGIEFQDVPFVYSSFTNSLGAGIRIVNRTDKTVIINDFEAVARIEYSSSSDFIKNHTNRINLSPYENIPYNIEKDVYSEPKQADIEVTVSGKKVVSNGSPEWFTRTISKTLTPYVIEPN